MHMRGCRSHAALLSSKLCKYSLQHHATSYRVACAASAAAAQPRACPVVLMLYHIAVVFVDLQDIPDGHYSGAKSVV
jgi:hypothetical protein